MRYVEKSAKTVEDAVIEALVELGITSEEAEIEVLDKGATGFFGFLSNKTATVRVYRKLTIDEMAEDFLKEMFEKMKMDVQIKITMKDSNMDVELSGNEMGVLIGKRGQTLDSIQYILSLVVNKSSEQYIRVRLDTENYRKRRKETLENLASSIAFKVKKTGKKFSLEPMNPYERRIIHYKLQNNKFVKTHSEGNEPYRKVIITPNKKK